jgi:hypothetical protein
MFEHYHVKLLETTLRFYYISSLGKIGYVLKSELQGNKKMDEKLIHWVEGKTIVRALKPYYVIVVNSEKYFVKKVVAKYFLRNYKPSDHLIHHKDDNYLNCSVENLYLTDKKAFYRKKGKFIKNKPIEVRKKGGKDYKLYQSITDAAKDLFVYSDTLANYLNRKTYYSILSEYDFRIDGIKFIPRKKTGANWRIKLG